MSNFRAHIRLPHFAHPVLMLALVLGLAGAVTLSATVVHVDAAAGRLARGLAHGLPLDVGLAISSLAATDFVMPLTIASALLLGMLRHWRGALTLLLSVLATQGVVALLKLVVERPRPAANGGMAEASGFSFPSAHSATAVAVYATLTVLLAGACRGRLRVAVVMAGIALIAAIGLSRILLAAHYPIDVFAGWLTGAALALASWLLIKRLVRVRPLPAPA